MKYLIVFCMLFSMGCATASNLNDLHPGMTSPEVQDHLGSPSHTEVVNGKTLEVYHLRYFSKAMQGIFAVFYGLVFIPRDTYKVEYGNDGKLVSYYK